MGIYLSPAHGVNPSVEKCFFCLEDRGVVLFGRLKGDAEAPRTVVLNKEPCDNCRELMGRGIILISVDESKSEDRQNPWRSGGWCVVKDEAVRRMITTPELLDAVLEKRMAFVPDDAWDKIGLPRGPVQVVPNL